LTWTRATSLGSEAAKIKWELPRYTRGTGLDVGCGKCKAFDRYIGVDDYSHTLLFGHQFKADVMCKAENLHLFADRSLDFVFSSHLLEHMSDPGAVLKEWSRIVKDGGHLILYLPDEDEYPKVGEDGANPDHKWNVNYERIVEMMDAVERNWDLVRFEKRNLQDEYSLFFVFRFIGGECS
jgi:predicted SAM-dependent methyltransferase